jgi:photosystem II stability/assembly factor-like uncharacterized protein
MNRRRLTAWALGAMATSLHAAGATGFNDPRDTPARLSRLAESGPQTAVAAAGERLVAVGPRGQILVSEAGTAAWRQVPVPVSVDLTALTFATPLLGWAVGHDGIVLHSADGGQSWVKQLDGRQIVRTMTEFYKRREGEGDAAAAAALAEVARMQETDGSRPLLSVWFRDARHGFVVGSFNLVLRTVDGGATWEPWFHRTDNPRLSSLYAVAGDERDVFIAGEQGLLMKLDPAGERFRALKLPYEGSLFGALVPRESALVVFGMRGNVLATPDGGASWRKVVSDEAAGITAGALLPDGRYLLATQSGRLLQGSVNADRLQVIAVRKPTAYAGIAVSAGRLGTAGWSGVAIEDLVHKP